MILQKDPGGNFADQHCLANDRSRNKDRLKLRKHNIIVENKQSASYFAVRKVEWC